MQIALAAQISGNGGDYRDQGHIIAVAPKFVYNPPARTIATG
jgi:hypothetical protein